MFDKKNLTRVATTGAVVSGVGFVVAWGRSLLPSLDIGLKAASYEIDAAKQLTNPSSVSLGKQVLAKLGVEVIQPTLGNALAFLVGGVLLFTAGWLTWHGLKKITDNPMVLGRDNFGKIWRMTLLGTAAVTAYVGWSLGILASWPLWVGMAIAGGIIAWVSAKVMEMARLEVPQ